MRARTQIHARSTIVPDSNPTGGAWNFGDSHAVSLRLTTPHENGLQRQALPSQG